MVESTAAEPSPAPRHKVDLYARVIVTAVGKSDDGEVNYSFFRASTYDLSSSGLGIVIHQSEVEELSTLGKETVFRFTLPIRAGAVELEAEPVRFELLEADGEGLVLVGVRITKIDDTNAQAYARFVRMLQAGC